MPDANGALIAINTLVSGDRWDDLESTPADALAAQRSYGEFDPID